MAGCMLLVLSDAVDGREDEFNDWYTNRHLADIVALPGFRSAKRYRLRTLNMGAISNKYLAIYEIDADDPERAVAEMFALRDTAAMPLSPAFDLDRCNVAIFEACSDEVLAPDAAAPDAGS
jgi:hypothetical protein